MRTLSSAAIAAAMAQETGTAWIVLLTLSHPTMAEPIRVSSDAVNTVSRGNTFIPFPFLVTLPDHNGEKIPAATLTIDNIDRAIVQSIRSIGNTPLSLLIEVVTSN